MVRTSKSNKKPLFSKKDNAVRFLMIVVLSVLGYVFMLLGKIPKLQSHGFLEYEISDLFVILAYALYGFTASVVVAVVKVGLVMLTFFKTIPTPIPIGYIINLISSLVFSISFLILDRCMRSFRRILPFRILTYLVVILAVTCFMVSIDYIFATPIALNNYEWTTIYDYGVDNILASNSSFFPVKDNYGLSIIYIYGPFNIIKSACICFIYETVFHRFIYYYLKSGLFSNGYFMNKLDYKKRASLASLKKMALKKAKFDQIKEKKIKNLKKSNARKELENPTVEKHHDITLYTYRYDFQISAYGSVRSVSILTESETASLIINFMENNYPGAPFVITYYKEKGEIRKDASSDGLSKELFRSVNKCDLLVTSILDVHIELKRKTA